MNLIITCARHLEPETRDELNDILEDFGDSDAQISINSSLVSGSRCLAQVIIKFISLKSHLDSMNPL